MLRNLVFAGCGVKGMGYLGAIERLEAHGRLTEVRRLGGASSGALLTGLLAVGASPAWLLNAVRPDDLAELLSRAPRVAELLRSPWTFGLRTAGPVEDWLRDRIGELTHEHLGKRRPELTFAELAVLADEYPTVFRHAHIVATNLTRGRAEIFDAVTTPHVSVAQAVRYSMGIPAVLAAAEVDGSVLVDGGLIWNYPFQLFAGRARPPLSSAQCERLLLDPDPAHTLGFVMNTREELGLEDEGMGDQETSISTVLDYVSSVFLITTHLATVAYLDEHALKRTVFIDGGGVSPVDFTVGRAEYDRLVDNGRAATDAWLRGEAPPPSVAPAPPL